MIIVLLGPPGSGKGTIAEKLEKEFHFFHLSPGELLREEIAKGTTLGKTIKAYLDRGDLVPDRFVVDLVKLEMKGKKKVILDGFPRSINQAKSINDLSITMVLYLDVPEKEVVKRLSGRRVCQQGTHNYHVRYIPPQQKGFCDYDGTKLVRRKDDTPKAIKERFKVYYRQTAMVIAFYRRQKLLKRINAAQAPDQVYAEVKEILKGNRNSSVS